MRFAACAVFILSLLWDSVKAESSISSLRAAAVAREGELPCIKWDCDCAFNQQRGCCCGAPELNEVEDQIFVRMMNLWTSMSQLDGQVLEVIGGIKVAFSASMSPRTNCFGPFTRNSAIPYDVITLNHGNGYNPALGIFTAPRSGLYSFSFSIYSKVDREGERMYYKVQLMKNGEVMASIWEDNREDSEDSSTQTVLLSVQQGGQVYVELLNSRQLCGIIENLNNFSGSLVYSSPT